MTVTSRQIKARDKLRSLGYSIAGACALTGNFVQESGKDLPSAFRTGKLDHGSQGLPQWRLARLTSYQNFVQDKHPEVLKPGMTLAQADKALWPWFGNMDLQLEFVAKELVSDYPELDKKLRHSDLDVATLAADVCWQYERPNKELSGIANRIATAQALGTDALAKVTPIDSLADFPPPVQVVDHLRVTAKQHEAQSTGGVITAGVAMLGAGGVFLSNFVTELPRWELILIIVLTALAAMCIVAAIGMRKKANDVRSAVPYVSNVPKPTDPDPVLRDLTPIQVAPSPGLAPPVTRAVSVLDDPDVQAAIQLAVANALAQQQKAQAQSAVATAGTAIPLAPKPGEEPVIAITEKGMSFTPDPVKVDTEVVERMPQDTTMTIGRAAQQ